VIGELVLLYHKYWYTGETKGRNNRCAYGRN